MKTQIFIRKSLLFPYALWVILAGFMFVMYKIFPASETMPILSGIIKISFIYTFGILVWGIPYTILAFGLWIWSKGKPVRTTAKVFALSPFMMAVIIASAMNFLLKTGDGVSPDFGEMIAALGGFSLLYGYAVIGIVAGIYNLLKKLNYILPEIETSPTQPA